MSDSEFELNILIGYQACMNNLRSCSTRGSWSWQPRGAMVSRAIQTIGTLLMGMCRRVSVSVGGHLRPGRGCAAQPPRSRSTSSRDEPRERLQPLRRRRANRSQNEWTEVARSGQVRACNVWPGLARRTAAHRSVVSSWLDGSVVVDPAETTPGGAARAPEAELAARGCRRRRPRRLGTPAG